MGVRLIPQADDLLRLQELAGVARDEAGHAENASPRSRLCPSHRFNPLIRFVPLHG